MFGWELPPYNSGGLGTACLGLSKELVPLGVDLDFVVPEVFERFPFNHMNILSAAKYSTSEEIERFLKLSPLEQHVITQSIGYGNYLVTPQDQPVTVQYGTQQIPAAPHSQARWYAYQAASIAQQKSYDLVHCHEWMTYYCGIAAKKVSQSRGEHIPFVAQVHATEMDRGGEGGNPAILEIEKAGLQAADRVVAVSHYTKQMIHKHYEIPNAKISVVHNGISSETPPQQFNIHALKKHFKLVLFMGRITMSKGPDYFIKLAKAVTDRDPKIKFIMVGSGDMEKKCIEMAAEQGLTGRILFSPFLRGEDVNQAYQLADLFIMPSVSEPFGLVALEALHNGVPAIVSKQSGVAEVSENLVKIDFWDTEAMQKAVLELLYSPSAAKKLSTNGRKDLQRLSWQNSAKNMQSIYQELIQPTHA